MVRWLLWSAGKRQATGNRMTGGSEDCSPLLASRAASRQGDRELTAAVGDQTEERLTQSGVLTGPGVGLVGLQGTARSSFLVDIYGEMFPTSPVLGSQNPWAISAFSWALMHCHVYNPDGP